MLEHRCAKLAVCATFLLLLVGGTVNPTGSSLACPEAWFVCKGTMFPTMSGGVLFEHGHRLTGMVVGLLQITLTALLWFRRPQLRRVAVLALVLVCLQGSLGATTVHYKLPPIVSTTHLVTAMFYFALVVYQAWVTRPSADSAPLAPSVRGKVRRLAAVAGIAVYAQIALGAAVRHWGGALACVDLPLCQGSLLPAGAPTPLVLHMMHRLVGVIVGLLVIAHAILVSRALSGGRSELAGPRGTPGPAAPRWLRTAVFALPLLVLTQITLGVLAIYTFREVPVVVAHTGCAALLLGGWTLVWLAAASPRAEAAAVEEAPLVALREVRS